MNYSLSECWLCIDKSENFPKRQEIVYKSKLIVWLSTGSPSEKFKYFLLKRVCTLWRMLTHSFYFVNHISYHVTLRSRKSSHRFMELFLWIYEVCHLLYLKLKPKLHWFQKYKFQGQPMIKTEISIKSSIKWSKWPFLWSCWKNGHVTHHFEAYAQLINNNISIIRKNDSEV